MKRLVMTGILITCLIMVFGGNEVSAEPKIDYILGRPLTEEEIQEQVDLTNMFLENNGFVQDNTASPQLKVIKDNFYLKANYPSAYDSRSVNGKSYITPVRNQNPYGTCWAFSSIACVESNLIKNGYATPDVDLSESHLIFFSNFSAKDVLENDYKDEMRYDGTLEYLHRGGNAPMAYAALSKWKGAVSEEYAPYEDAEAGFSQSAEVAYLNDQYHLQGFYYLDGTDRNLVKEAIMTYGAVSMCYYAVSDTTYFNYSTMAQYCNEEKGTNHEVTIIGWDDTYSKDNFNTRPSSDGAWLIKNSWGDCWGINDGYFWLSYEDATIYEEMYVFEVETADNYDNNYQYDFGPIGLIYPVGKAASVFEIKANKGAKEKLEAVAIDFRSSNVKYSIQIYKNLTDLSDPTSGTALLSTPQTGQTTYSGYYTIPVKESIVLEEGDIFSVVFVLESVYDNETPCIGAEYSYSSDTVVSSKRNQSYVGYSDWGGWTDHGASETGNLSIKAFTNNIDETTVKVSGVEFEQEKISIYVGDSIVLTPTVLPANATNKSIVWECDDTNVATVSQTGKVTGISEGVTTITVRTLNGGYEASCCVTVNNIPVTSVKIDKDNLTMEEYDIEFLTATVYPDNATVKDIIWSSSNEDVVLVYNDGQVYAEGVGTAVVTATTMEGGYTAECAITVLPWIYSVYFQYDNIIGYVGETVSLSCLEINGTPGAPDLLTWTSSDPDIISVDGEGNLSLKRPGTARIKANAHNGSSYSCDYTVMLPPGGYIGNINSELISFDLKRTDAGAYYLTGQIVVVEWVDGLSTVPEVAPIMSFKSTDGTEEIEVFVTPTGTNTYYFDRFIEGLSSNKEYVFEITSGNDKNYSPYRSMNVSLATSPKLPSKKELGTIGEQKINYYQAPNGELRLYQKGSAYVGNINSELLKTELVKGPNGNYVSGQIVVVEWVDGLSTVPRETPIMHFKSLDGLESLPVFVTPTGTNTYYFDRSLGDMDTSKEYVFTIESGDELNISPYRSMIVTTAAMTNKEGLLWQSDTQYVRYRTDANTAELRIYAEDK